MSYRWLIKWHQADFNCDLKALFFWETRKYGDWSKPVYYIYI